MQKLTVRRHAPKKWWHPSRWELMEEFRSECGITVPAHFISDGLSIPLGLRWLFSPTGIGFNAAVVHDWLLLEGHPWAHATERFEEQLVCDDVPAWMRKMYVSGVEIWGGLKSIGT